MPTFRFAALLSASVLLSGCATPYASSGLTGGYFQKRVNHKLVQVNFTGNAYITPERIQTFALYRCAQMAHESNKPYFVLYDSLTAAARDVPSRQPRVGTLGGKPIAIAFMLMEDDARPGAQDVKEILATLKDSVDPGAEVKGSQR